MELDILSVLSLTSGYWTSEARIFHLEICIQYSIISSSTVKRDISFKTGLVGGDDENNSIIGFLELISATCLSR